MAKTANQAQWTDVIDVFVQPDRDQGGYIAFGFNAREEELAWDVLGATVHTPFAVGERGALLDVSAELRKRGYEPVGRWAPDGEESGALCRSFRRAKPDSKSD